MKTKNAKVIFCYGILACLGIFTAITAAFLNNLQTTDILVQISLSSDLPVLVILLLSFGFIGIKKCFTKKSYFRLSVILLALFLVKPILLTLQLFQTTGFGSDNIWYCVLIFVNTGGILFFILFYNIWVKDRRKHFLQNS